VVSRVALIGVGAEFLDPGQTLTVAGAPIGQLATTGLTAILIGLGLLLVSVFVRRRESARESDRESLPQAEAGSSDDDLAESAAGDPID
jgi:hypothetical protein